ncbi:glycosyltransferase family 2 protein, partial [Escherichia coli]|nr:glycosyltransferase family 2 protein [Escherichia coli]EFO3133983.1 glycosyltransferase family 2 protein [Escherichia coli O109]EEW5709982.1 glycosyltransferase family 2 protein [Escherichia coli]EFB3797246.1 glycosyltransferase family 2 protein [Escherichia coli]EKB2372182.1 glycosyltransferase family 2 protein [Escherichia coli]
MAFLSIVIPTRNRPQYLARVVELIASNTCESEVIVADNSDNDSLKDKLKKYTESGLVKYYYTSENLSVVDNFEKALEKVTGKYIIFLGDDDGIGPQIENIAHWMDDNHVDAAFSYSDKFLVNYYWPGVKSKFFDDKYSSRIFISKFDGSVQFIDSISARSEVRDAPGTGLNNLPRIYHGLVSFNLIAKIKAKGNLFGGISPDIFSAYQIATEAKKIAKINYPFVIPGGCKESTAGQRAAKSDNGSLAETEHTARFGNSLVWDSRIPQYYSPYNVWAYSLLKAVERTDGKVNDFNFYRLYVISYLRYKNFRSYTLSALSEAYKKPSLAGFIKALFAEFNFFVNRVTNKILKNKKESIAA